MKPHSHNVFHRLLPIVALLGSTILAPVSGMQAQARSKTRSEAQAASVRAYLRSEMRHRGIPGLQVAVVRHGRLVLLGAYGVAYLQYAVPVTHQTVFPICSITKAFTGVAMMQLVERGQLDLTAPVSNYLDGLPAPWQVVTIRQLLSNMSGIPNIIDNNSGVLVGGGGEDAAWAWVQAQPMSFAPGERFDYSQTNYVLLGKIIDKLSGEPFIRFFTERQFQVAQMSRTGFGDSRDVVRDKAQCYGYDYASPTPGGKLRNNYESFPPFRRTASGMNSTAEDLARWIIALQQGRILKKKASLTTLWTQVAFNNGQLGQWALGWGVVLNRPMHRAVGMTGGGRAAFYLYPDDDLAVVILTNLAGGWPEELIDPVASYYIPKMRLPGISALRLELQKRGFGNARAVVAELRKKDASLQLPEVELNDWGYRLLTSGKPKQALEIFKLIVSLHPESGNAYDSLADGYEVNGDRALAIQNYKRSLELDPKNTNAVKRLKKLEADGTGLRSQ
jgi:CubicO group peptidase (beta-lactamase class C family)